MKQALTRLLPLMLYLSIPGIFTGCNNSAEEKKTTDTTSINTNETQKTESTEGTAATTTRFSTFKMTKANFITVFSSNKPGQVMMLYFQYPRKEDRTRDFSRLQVYGADEAGQDLNDPFDLVADPAGPVRDFDMGKGYDQQITIGQLRNYLGMDNGSTDPVPTGSYTDVWLVPCTAEDTEGNELLYYKVIPVGTNPANCPDGVQRNQAGSISTNPSPPGRPCEDACGNGQILKRFTKSELLKYIDKNRTN